MATYMGTPGVDTFNGAKDVADTFEFNAGTLSGSDIASGGGGAVRDVFQVTALGDIFVAQLAGVSGIEKVVLFGNSSFNLTYNMLATARKHTIQVVGSTSNDTVNSPNNTDPGMTIQFDGGDGDDTYYGGFGGGTVDKITGGSGQDNLFGGDGKDTLDGGFHNDFLDGGAGNDRLFGGIGDDNLLGGAGKDKITASFGSTSMQGGSGKDTMKVMSGDGGYADGIVYVLESDGGATGDIVRGGLDYVSEGDIRFWFDQGSFAAFNTDDDGLNEEVFDDGSSTTGPGGPIDGTDAVFYDGSGTGIYLGSASAVDSYFDARFYDTFSNKAFLAEKNPDGSVTVYFDTAVHSADGSVLTMAHVENYSGTITGLMAYFDAF